jgi:predicted nucleic acid-binding protein
MVNRGSLDANVILRLLLNDVPEQHQQARALIAREGTFVVADAAVVEVIFVLGRAYDLSREQQYEAVVGVLSLPQIESSLEAVLSSFELYLEHPKLSFEDCWLVTASQRDGAEPLWTFDKKLANQTNARLIGTA